MNFIDPPKGKFDKSQQITKSWPYTGLFHARPSFHNSALKLSCLIQLQLSETSHNVNVDHSDLNFFANIRFPVCVRIYVDHFNFRPSIRQTCEGKREGDICCRSVVSLTNDCGCSSEISVLTRLSAEQTVLDAFSRPTCGGRRSGLVSTFWKFPPVLGLHASGGGDFARAPKPQIYVHRRAASNGAQPP